MTGSKKKRIVLGMGYPGWWTNKKEIWVVTPKGFGASNLNVEKIDPNKKGRLIWEESR